MGPNPLLPRLLWENEESLSVLLLRDVTNRIPNLGLSVQSLQTETMKTENVTLSWHLIVKLISKETQENFKYYASHCY